MSTTLYCDTVPEHDRLEITREGEEYMTYLTIINERRSDDDSGPSTQRAEVHFTSESIVGLIHALGGVVHQDLVDWRDNNPDYGNSVDQLLKDDGLFPAENKPPCEHADLKLEQDTWSPGYEALHASCAHCGIVLRLDQSEDQFEVED